MAKRKRKPSSTVDRLSALHESILLHILSFLPTKDSIKTSVLSKRFRHAWASVPALRLTLNSPGDVDVVDRLLALHSAPSISTFRINVTGNYDLLDSVHGRACSWIDHAAARNVRDLKIDLGRCCLEPKILDRIFRCQFLETLTLKREIKKLAQPPSPLTPFFTNLRTLKLHLVSRPSGSKLTGELISNCCNLQVLCLHAEGFRFLRISAPRLQRLQLGLTGWWTSEVEISCPGLVEFDFRIGHEVEKFRGDMPSLCRASFKTNFPPRCPVWIPIFRSVCNAETLQLFCLDCSEVWLNLFIFYTDDLHVSDSSELPLSFHWTSEYISWHHFSYQYEFISRGDIG